ncbi:MAG TPA: peptidoglycan editing factor PgeF [Casimicrobiaceae bacterium]|nr:peptidoglycan editing factor PgeF [Casimicrobiaceae bacterium]
MTRDWIIPSWHGPSRVRAVFTTRNGGVSTGPAKSMDVGAAHATAADLAGAIGENRRRLRALLPSDPVWLSQVHGRETALVDGGNAPAMRESPPQADAAVTRTPGVVLTVRTADCLPVLLADREGSVLGVAHAGWRGLAGGVLDAAVAALRVPAHDIAAWIGPGIGAAAFEVGADVRTAYCDADARCAPHFTPLREGKWLADLAGLARQRLTALGVTDIAFDPSSCTFTDTDRFFSYRRDRRCGRMALAAWLDA